MDAGIKASIPQTNNNNNNNNNSNNSSNNNVASSSRYKILNETHLLRDRCVNFNQKSRGQLESLCEDKVSRHKLERVHYSLPSSVKSTFIMTFSPDGRKVASTHGDHCIYICDLNTGKLLDTLYGHHKTPWCLAWHPSNKDILASGCIAGEVRVWDLGSKLKAPESWTSDNNSIISSLDFHPKERILVIATANDILFWDWAHPKPFAKTTTTHNNEKIKFVEFDSSGTRLITGISNIQQRFSGCSSDSLQNRIIDSYLAPGHATEPLPTENMTQNSETNTPPNNNESTTGERISAETLPYLADHNRPSTMPINAINNEEADLDQRSTLTLSRIAHLYRQLDGLEDSLRPLTFAPYQSVRPSFALNPQPANQDQQQQQSAEFDVSSPSLDNEVPSFDTTGSPTSLAPSRHGEPSLQSPLSEFSRLQQEQRQESTRSTSSLEPFVVSFDESLQNLQLSPLVIDGQTINLATILEQYSTEFPNQVHFMVHYDSLNQVNQNFIRISKLMSSVRLYRQIVQQILSSNSGSGYPMPNQFLTAPSVRSTRSPGGIPIVFRNLQVGSTHSDGNSSSVPRSSDPVMAIQFLDSARNIPSAPFATICKIDLLIARCFIIMRSQQLIERAMIDLRPSIRTYQISLAEMMGGARNVSSQMETQPSMEQDTNNLGTNYSFYHLLSQLHSSLKDLKDGPLTTSNVHTHISPLITVVGNLLTALTSLLPTREEGCRLTQIVHSIANSLTGRAWNLPLGETLNEIRLDVIHNLCIVDLTLHLTRQIQLLQMHRLSAMSRIEEYRASTSSQPDGTSNSPVSGPASSSRSLNQTDNLFVPSTSRESSTVNQQTKRKNDDQIEKTDDIVKRRKKDSERGSVNNDVNMIDSGRDTSSTDSANQREHLQTLATSQNATSPMQSVMQRDSLPVERLIVWNSSQGQTDEQSLQRFLFATAASMNNSHILVRIYHRAGGNSSNILDTPNERTNPPIESRRRALSQDNSSVSSQEGPSSPVFDGGRVRYALQSHAPTMGSSNSGSAAGYEAWHRAPHFHVIHARGPGQHLWFNQWTISLPFNSYNYRLQCWNFSLDSIPSIKDSQSNILTQRCRIMNDSSIDLSSDGNLLACLVLREEGASPSFDLKVFSLKSWDFGACYHQVPHGSNAISVSLSPTANYVVVGLASHKYISNDPNDDDLTIAKVFNLSGRSSPGYVRDIKIKRDDSSLSLNAIRWMSSGIVYNVGPQHHRGYQTARMRNRFV